MVRHFALGLLIVPGLALASGNTAPAASSTDKGSKLICREVEEIGSRLGGKRICMTRDQWEEERRNARSTVEKAQSQQINPCATSPKTC
ncbi:MAG TPA: hypothetical protein VFW19_04535 [Allosphingosinicella sp.]|nr:hypothetical protein [Allosphingosinicella sp.]